MLTKSEEEWLMDEAIYKKINHLLIKPVNLTKFLWHVSKFLKKES